MQRVASQHRHGTLLPKIVVKGIDPASGLCRAEQELYILLQRSHWNDLGPSCRMTLLRDCALHHLQWENFTPRCQLWVLHEVSRASGEASGQPAGPLTDEAALDTKEALECVRLKSLVQADMALSKDLADVYEQTPALKQLSQRFRAEHKAQEDRLLLASSKSLGNTGGQRQLRLTASGPLTPKSPTSPMAMTMPVGRLQRSHTPTRSDAARTLPRMASAPDLGKAGKLAPLSNTRRGGGSPPLSGADARGARGAPKAGDSGAGAALKRATSKLTNALKLGDAKRPPSRELRKTTKPPVEDSTTDKAADAPSQAPGNQKGRAAAAPDPVPSPYFKEAVVELAANPDAPSQISMLVFRTCLPTESRLGKQAKLRDDLKKVTTAAMARTIQAARDDHARLQHLPMAFVYVEGPGVETRKVAQQIESATKDLDVSVEESREDSMVIASEDAITYEVRIHDSTTITRLREILESYFGGKNLLYDVLARPPYERVLEAFARAFPELGSPELRDVEALTPILDESYHLYAEAWTDLKANKEVADKLKDMQEKESRVLCDGVLVCLADARGPPDLLRHSANTGEEVLAGAMAAHMKLKEMLAPGSEWAVEVFNDLEEVPVDDERRVWTCQAKGLFKNVAHYDPGVVVSGGGSELEARARFHRRPYETAPQVCEVLGLSHIDITFTAFPQLGEAIDEFIERFPVVWVDNMFEHPNYLGERYVSLGVRVAWQGDAGAQHEHIAELRLHQQALRSVSTDARAMECEQRLGAALCALGLPAEALPFAREVMLRVLDGSEAGQARVASRAMERLATWVYEFTSDLVEELSASEMQAVEAMVALFAEQASGAGVPDWHVQRLVERSKKGWEQEAQEWRVKEAHRTAQEEAEREAREAEERRQQDEEARRAAEEEAARVAAEEALDREVAELKAAKKAADEAKRRAKEEDVARKAAEREAEKQRLADIEARAKERTEAYLQEIGLGSVHEISPTSGKTALLMAAGTEGERMAAIVESLLMKDADIRAMRQEDGASVMHEAAAAGAVDSMEVLLRWGAALEAQTETGLRPVHFAAMAGQVEAVEFLVQAKAKFDSKSTDGITPLFAAAAKDQVDTAFILVQAGAAVDQLDDAGRTLLHIAALNNAGGIARFGLDFAIDPAIKDNDGKTASQLAKKNKSTKVLEVLQQE